MRARVETQGHKLTLDRVEAALSGLPESERRRVLDSLSGEGDDLTDPQTRDGPIAGETSADAPTLAEPTTRTSGHADATRPLGSDSDQDSEIIGAYHLREVLGEGAFGKVFRAEQTAPVRREVAVKVIKRGMDTDRVIRRFDAEKQALAMMEHPGIAKVLDAGVTPSGLPYFVMELVRGEPISRYCDNARMNIRDRLGLFLDVCHALQHAHQKGIVHRDIKPTNVLVAQTDAGPMPKIIDFGVAKATRGTLIEEVDHTRADQPIGTPLYMAPEQSGRLATDVDTRADIYALGALLCELLVGVTPLDPTRYATFNELAGTWADGGALLPRPTSRYGDQTEQREIAEKRGTSPKHLSGLVRGDLDWIVAKCLEFDRDRRYATATALAEDIQRHLAHEPVVASRPSTLYTAKKFLRRRWPQVTVAGVIFVSLVVGLAGTALGWDAARVRTARLETTLDFFADTLTGGALSPPGEVSWADAPSVTLGDALRDSESQIARAFDGAPELGASVRHLVGLAQLRAGEFEGAARQLSLAHEIRSERLGETDPRTLTLLLPLAESILRSGDWDRAIEISTRAFELSNETRGPDDIETRAAALWTGRWHAAAYHFTDAEKYLDLAEQSAEGAPDAITLAATAEKTTVLVSEGKLAAAEGALRRLIERAGYLPEPPAGEIARFSRFLGYVLVLRGKFEEAQSVLTDPAAMTTPDDGSDRVRRRLLAWSLGLSGRADEASAMFDTLIDLELESPGPVFRETFARLYYADILNDHGRTDLALSQVTSALSRYDEAGMGEDPDRIWAMLVHARTLLDLGRTDEAGVTIEAAVLAQARFEEHVLYRAELALLRSRLAHATGRASQAIGFAREAQTHAAEVFGYDHPTSMRIRDYIRAITP